MLFDLLLETIKVTGIYLLHHSGLFLDAAHDVQSATQELADATASLIEQVDGVDFPVRFASMEETISESTTALDKSQDELNSTI